MNDWQIEQTWKRWLDEYYETRPRPDVPIHAIAEITFLTTDEGGRANPICSGYRGQFYYDGGDWDARFTFAIDPVPPEVSVETIIQFLSPQSHWGRIHAGMEFMVMTRRLPVLCTLGICSRLEYHSIGETIS